MSLVTFTGKEWIDCTYGTVADEQSAISTTSHSATDLSGAFPHNLFSEPQAVSQALGNQQILLAWVK